MGIQTVITVTHDKEVAADINNLFVMPVANTDEECQVLQGLLEDLACGTRNGLVSVQVAGGNAVAASGTLTLTTVVATDSCVINGETFAAVASGATGNQFNVGASDTVTAANLAASINASVSAPISGIVSATSSGTVVTVSAVALGVAGNGYTLTGSTQIVASGIALAGGAAATGNVYHYGL